MSWTLPELKEALVALEAKLPRLREDYPNAGDFWPIFAGEADVIEDSAGEHKRFVSREIERMLDATRAPAEEA